MSKRRRSKSRKSRMEVRHGRQEKGTTRSQAGREKTNPPTASSTSLSKPPRAAATNSKWDTKLKCYRLDKSTARRSHVPLRFRLHPQHPRRRRRSHRRDALDGRARFPGLPHPVPLSASSSGANRNTGETVRNDRLLAVASDAHNYRDVHQAQRCETKT